MFYLGFLYVDELGMDNRDQYDYAWNERGNVSMDLPLFCHSRQKKIIIYSHLLSKRRDLGKNSLTLLIEPSL